MLIKYLYDYSCGQKRPWACIAAVKTEDGIRYGASFCHKNDHFLKARARQIAEARAFMGVDAKPPQGWVTSTFYEDYQASKETEWLLAIQHMKLRAEKYFR